MQVSHETIYQYIYLQAKRELKKTRKLSASVKTTEAIQKLGEEKRGTIPDIISICPRSREVVDRVVPGH